MNSLEQFGPSRWIDFLSIKAYDPQELCVGAEHDLFIGKNKVITLTIPNGQTLQFRDVVVLGTLIVQSSDLSNETNKAKIICKNMFIQGVFTIRNIDMKTLNNMTLFAKQGFETQLYELMVDQILYQKQIIDKIGLKSILI